MKIPINLSILNIDIDKKIKESLEEQGLPGCLGCMFPPLVEYDPEVEITDLFMPRESINAVDRMDIATHTVVPNSHADKVVDTVISKDSYDTINKQMKQKAQEYASSLLKCTKCPHIAVCDKLTRNYLKLVELSLNN